MSTSTPERLGEQLAGGVEAGRPDADDRDAEREPGRSCGNFSEGTGSNVTDPAAREVIGVDLRVPGHRLGQVVVAEIASTGHASTQSPQSMQVSGSM